jgi:outer membrane protein assembly factor BamA
VSITGDQEYSLGIGEQNLRDTTFTLPPLARGLAMEFNGRPVNKQAGQTLSLDVDFDRLPQEDFYGVGPHSLRTNLSDFLYQTLAVDGVWGLQFNRWLGWSVRGGFLGVNIQPGTNQTEPGVQAVFPPASIPGLGAAPDFLHFETGLLADYRDKPADAHNGGIFALLLGHFDDLGNDQFRFNRISAETRQYLPLWSNYRTLALRFLTSFDRPASGKEVPFYLMESLGGVDSIRGFPEYRFRDRNLMLMSAEYRWDVGEFLQMVLFYDTGKVFARPADFGLSGLEKGFGGGLRVRTGGRVFLRMELGRSREGNEFHFRLGPAF